MKILLVCSAGISTSHLEKNMIKHINDNNLNYSVTTKNAGESKAVLENYDVILLGPQVRFMEEEFQRKAKKAIGVIPVQIYGMMQGKEAIELAKTLFKKFLSA